VQSAGNFRKKLTRKNLLKFSLEKNRRILKKILRFFQRESTVSRAHKTTFFHPPLHDFNASSVACTKVPMMTANHTPPIPIMRMTDRKYASGIWSGALPAQFLF